jgi:hypothetical protein
MSDERVLKHDFFEIEYDKALEIVHKLHDMRLAYQKFYVSMAGSIIAIAILAAHFPPGKQHGAEESTTSVATIAKLMPVEMMIGFLFLICSIVGYVVVRNLVSIRRNEVYWTNFAISLRNHMMEHLDLPVTYPKLGEMRGIDWNSADFQTILACSVINVFIALIGSGFFLDGAKPQHITLALVPVAAIYFYLHIQSIRIMGSPVERNAESNQMANPAVQGALRDKAAQRP